MIREIVLFCCLIFCCTTAQLQAQNTPAKDTVASVPPPGIEISKEDLHRLEKQLSELNSKIEELQKNPNEQIQRLLPDVQIFSEAIRKALAGKTFFSKKDVPHAEELIKAGLSRAEELAHGKHSWTKKNGLIVRGYRSRLDGSIQPYGLVIGPDVKVESPDKVRCDIWFRGRSVKGLELQFLYERMHRPGRYELQAGIMLHPFGRYCNANRFAGEVDVFEALEDVKKNYSIDEDRLSVRGFSMGGASTWGFTVHYPCKWFASNPGAGFSETLRFLGFDKNPDQLPPEYQRKLWTLYDADILADNLFNVPTIAYSGEIDKQREASEIMVAAAAARGITIPHIIGPKTAHSIHPESNKIIAEMMDEFAKAGRPQIRNTVRFCTYSLKYNRCAWIIINGLHEHWLESYVDGNVTQNETKSAELNLKTRNVSNFTIDFTKGHSPFKAKQPVAIVIDGQKVGTPTTGADGVLKVQFQQQAGQWDVADSSAPQSSALVKRHNLQGPIDDALMEPFLFVMPTGKFINPRVQKWVQEESQRAIREWRRQMRGKVRIKKDSELTAEDIQNRNLILWGCPQSNAVIQKVVKQLPIKWTKSELSAGQRKFDPTHQVPVLIYPNPENQKRYIVINSGLTYREADYLNNSRQTPKLPDWAIIDVVEPADDYVPGKIVAAEFFDEQWQLRPAAK